jgi:hypothetical protein
MYPSSRDREAVVMVFRMILTIHSLISEVCLDQQKVSKMTVGLCVSFRDDIAQPTAFSSAGVDAGAARLA